MEKIKKTQKTVSKEYCYMFLIGMYLLSMLLSFLFYGGLGSSLKKAYQVGLFSCVFLLPLWLLFYKIAWELKNKKRVFLLGLFFFGITMILVLVSVHINTYLFWFGGCIFLTVLFPTEIGLGFFLFFDCLFYFINDATGSYKVFLFLFGIVLCSLVSFIKKGKSIFIIVFIALVFYTLLFFILTHGSKAYFEWQSLISMIGQAIFLIIAYRLYLFLEKKG